MTQRIRVRCTEDLDGNQTKGPVRFGTGAQGLQVSERGRVPAEAIAQYEAARLMVVPL